MRVRERFVRKVFTVLSVLVLLGASTHSVQAADPGVYTASTVACYSHPVTGEIEDMGGESSIALGQSFVSSVPEEAALMEVDENGNVYATVRYKLADNYNNVNIQVQNWGDSGWMSTDFENVGSTGDTVDYRILLTSDNSVVRCSFYVVPMGREAVFYYYFTDWAQGNNTSFTPRISTDEQQDVTQSQAEPVVQQAGQEQIQEENQESTPEPTRMPTPKTEKKEKASPAPEVTQKTSPTSKPDKEKTDKETSAEKAGERDSEKKVVKAPEDNTNRLLITVAVAAGVILVGVGLAGVLWRQRKGGDEQ